MSCQVFKKKQAPDTCMWLHRYMLADDGQSLYVVFMGTKHMRDLLADANLFQEAVWKSEHPVKQQVISISPFLADLLCKHTYMHAATFAS